MKIILTGAAGFIGSNILRMLNDKKIENIVIVDNINTSEKWKNISNKSYLEYINKNEFLKRKNEFKDYEFLIHLGACSSTTQEDFDYLYKNNFEYSKELFNFSVENNIRFIYASSAATYGMTMNFDDLDQIKKLKPLNRYGYSKQLFDLWIEKQNKLPIQCVGLKFFNVYGPNEYAKGSMASMVFHGFNQITKTNTIKLFKSESKEYKDGEQLRDFIYVKDICNVIEWLMENEEINGLFNLGTGKARSFNDLAKIIFKELNLKENIQYIDMPEILMGKYQYYTQADMEKLKSIGYKKVFYSLEEGMKDYINNYLTKNYKIN